MLDLKDTASFMYTMIVYFTWDGFGEVMHQSIPPAPTPPPPGYCGAFARLVSPGGWAFAFLLGSFHCEDLFLRWSSNCSFTGVNCWIHPIFSGANCSSQHVISFLTDVNCWSHPIFYGANYSSHHVVSFFTGVNGLSHPMVYCATVQATIIVSSLINGC